MSGDASYLSRGTLHRELLPRISQLRGYVHRKIPRRLQATVSADDVLQEVWVAAYRTVSTFTPDGPNAIERWLTTIANSKVADAVRTARRLKRGGDRRHIGDGQQRVSSFTDLFARVQSPQKTPSSELGATERAHAVSIALNCLRGDRRRVIYMRYIEGRSHEEIGREMGKTKAAVNSLLYNGLLELRSLLGDAAKYFSDVRSSDAAGLGGPAGG